MTCRGIRGATTVEDDRAEVILSATRELLEHIIAANSLSAEDVTSAIFTVTPDLRAASPARAARELGWTRVPLLCVQEMALEDSLARCIRVLVLWNTALPAAQVRHIYLGEARSLRPDLAEGG